MQKQAFLVGLVFLSAGLVPRSSRAATIAAGSLMASGQEPMGRS